MKIGNRWIACFSSQVCFDSICSVCGATVMLRKEAAAVHTLSTNATFFHS